MPTESGRTVSVSNLGPLRRLADNPWLRITLFLVIFTALFFLTTGMSGDDEFPHGDFDEDCTLCHQGDDWLPVTISPAFDHDAVSGFTRRGAHLDLGCPACHESLNFAEAPRECAGCHRDVHLGELGSDCSRCHGEQSFIDHGTWLRRHSEFRLPLTGRHLTADCEECHLPQPQGRLIWVNLPVDCYACHRDDYDGTTNPDHGTAGYPTDCDQCHSTSGWHSGNGGHSHFPLTGAHRLLDCDACHADGYDGTPNDCYACHRDDYDGTENPDHHAAGYATDCEQCHSTNDWATGEDGHGSFPLTGGHSGLDCTACHENGQYQGTPTDCYACHRNDYDREHAGSGYPTDCTQCHTSSDWDADEAHGGFALTGGHGGLDCTACHENGQYQGTSTDCYACHRNDYDREHAGSGYPTDCRQCHTTAGWEGGADHSSYPLTGAHTTLDCDACHENGTYEGTPTDCYDCHHGDFDEAHNGSGFPHDCTECHSTSNWDAGYAHDSWALTGAHGALDCSACHGDGIYEGTPTDCWSCHADNYNDEHAGSGFPHDCTICHGTSSWNADDAHTDFPLTGGHGGLDCTVCHENGQYQGTPSDCWSCHENEYNDEHAGSGFPHDCTECHTIDDWDADFAHTSWALNGAHTSVACTACHENGVYEGTPTDCNDCHTQDYNNEHGGDGYPRDCLLCHDETDWDSDYNHNTIWPLTGAHRYTDCTECHINGVWSGTPTLCYDCHREEYEDEHSSSTPRQCEECHNTSDWDDDAPRRTAMLDHDAVFPIHSGRHRNLWFSCRDCHPNKGNPAMFTCAGCHAPGDHPAGGLKKTGPAPSVFRSNDRGCLVCHPRGD